MALHLTLICILSAPQTGADLLEADESSFVAELDRARELMRAGRWAAARRGLGVALDAHRGRSYVFARRQSIDEDLCRCDFALRWTPPAWQDLLVAELHVYRPSSGRIHVSQAPLEGDLVEWRRADTDWAWEWSAAAIDPSAPPPRVWVHPARVTEDVVLRLRGPRFQAGTAVLVELQDVDQLVAVVFGRRDEPADRCTVSVVEVEGARVRRLAAHPSRRLKRSEAFELELHRGPRELRVEANGERVLELRHEFAAGAHAGFQGTGTDGRFELEGRIERAWLEGRRDRARQQAWRDHRREWRSASGLPLWLRSDWADPRLRRPRPREAAGAFVPGPPEVAGHATVESVFRLQAEDRHEQALHLLDQAPGLSLPEETVCYLKALSYVGLERLESALRFASRASQLSPSFRRSRELEASLYDSLHRPDLARVIYRGLLESNPGASSVYEGYAWFLLGEGDPGEADRVLAVAESDGIETASLTRARGIVEKARRGPMWPRSWRHLTTHYEVVSDIDHAACVAAAGLLERALEHYERNIRRLPPRNEPFQVYLFSGESGYMDYCRDLAIDLPLVTAGVYSRTLDQLLVWNLPDRASMLRTIRHEGFHQYLAALGSNAPRWFDEGMAEYHERALEVGTRLIPGRLDADDLEPLRDGCVPLHQFLHLDHAAFLRRPALHYAQSLAFVHFLHEDAEGQGVMSSLLSALAGGVAGPIAVEGVLAQVDLVAMEARFEAHVEGLRGGR